MADIEFDIETSEEESVGPASPAEFQAVVYTTDWTTETIISQMKRGNIIINPRFQRRDAWKGPRKSKFIESLILGLPIPQIVLAEETSRRGRFLVIDGKQRLLTLMQFVGEWGEEYKGFALGRLDVLPELNRKTFRHLQEDEELRGELDAFLNQPIRTVVIRDWKSSDYLHTVFIRLNTGNVSLSPQELRQALLPGRFVEFADERASESEPIRKLLKNTGPDFRMRDVELLIRFFGFTEFLTDYRGNLKTFLDFTCEKLNASWAEQEEGIRRKADQIDQALEAALEIFGPNKAGRKWVDGEFQPQLNRAILDALVFYFVDEEIRTEALRHSADVVEALQQLCESNDSFLRAIESTTKSIPAVTNRLGIWGETLSRVTGMEFHVPETNPWQPEADTEGLANPKGMDIRFKGLRDVD